LKYSVMNGLIFWRMYLFFRIGLVK